MKIQNREEAIKCLESVLNFLNQESSTKADEKFQDAASLAKSTQDSAQILSDQNQFEEIKKLLDGTEWPEAVPDFLICKMTEEDKMERAEGIIDFIDLELKNKKVLDFGCGEGHVVKLLHEKSVECFGFDLEKKGLLDWENQSGYLLTTDWNRILDKKPFEVVLLYDVLDHAQSPIDLLNQLREVCTPQTHIVVRTHPFCGPHGGHLYQKINKAYLHLICTEEELKQLGCDLEFNQKVLFPLATCESWFQQANYAISKSNTIKNHVSDFFKNNPIIRYRINLQYPKEFPAWQMSQAFNDYVVKMR